MKRLLLFAATCAIALFVAAPSFAATGVTLFGTATQEATDVKIVSDFSDAATTNDFGGVDIAVPAGTTFSSLTALSAQFQLQTGDCGGGSPRFQINVDGKNVMVYLGPSPSFTGCAAGTWIDSGNLVGTSDACRVDTSRLPGGKVCSTWAEAVALLGSHTVTGIQYAVDGGWKQAGKVQTVLVRSITVNGTTYSLVQETTPPPTGKVNPAKFCKALKAKMGSAAFNELWGTNTNAKNGFGKCVSTVAHARNAGKTEQQITDALTACIAKSLKGGPLGACVAARDGVAATKTEAQEHKAASSSKQEHGKSGDKKGHGKKK
jgi:hypothetical protein